MRQSRSISSPKPDPKRVVLQQQQQLLLSMGTGSTLQPLDNRRDDAVMVANNNNTSGSNGSGSTGNGSNNNNYNNGNGSNGIGSSSSNGGVHRIPSGGRHRLSSFSPSKKMSTMIVGHHGHHSSSLLDTGDHHTFRHHDFSNHQHHQHNMANRNGVVVSSMAGGGLRSKRSSKASLVTMGGRNGGNLSTTPTKRHRLATLPLSPSMPHTATRTMSATATTTTTTTTTTIAPMSPATNMVNYTGNVNVNLNQHGTSGPRLRPSMHSVSPVKRTVENQLRNSNQYSNHRTGASHLSSADDDSVDYRLYQTLFKKRKQQFVFSFGKYDTQGFRPTMEDEFFFIDNIDALVTKPMFNNTTQTHCMFGVFDGHCGRDAAMYCKENLPHHLLRSSHFQTSVEHALKDAFVKCDASLRRYTEEQGNGSPMAGCTANVTVIRDNILTVANCGDSRAVLADAGRAIVMSEDHKPNRPDEKQRIESLGGLVMFGRVSGLLAVSRALGDFEYKSHGKHLVSEVPDVKSYALHTNSDFIIVACDGLWDVISSGESVKLAYQWMLETHDLDKVCERLVLEALERGSMDNITCMIVAFHAFS